MLLCYVCARALRVFANWRGGETEHRVVVQSNRYSQVWQTKKVGSSYKPLIGPLWQQQSSWGCKMCTEICIKCFFSHEASGTKWREGTQCHVPHTSDLGQSCWEKPSWEPPQTIQLQCLRAPFAHSERKGYEWQSLLAVMRSMMRLLFPFHPVGSSWGEENIHYVMGLITSLSSVPWVT